jgi:hypothetical protein
VTHGGVTYMATVASSGVDIDGTKWDVWHFLPASTQDAHAGPDLYRALRRAAISLPKHVRGPWDIGGADKAIAAVSTSLRAPLLEGGDPGPLRVPIMFAGDQAPELAARAKYGPTDADCVSDVRPAKIELADEEVKDGR